MNPFVSFLLFVCLLTSSQVFACGHSYLASTTSKKTGRLLTMPTLDDVEPKYVVNTSNQLKLKEFKKYLGSNVVSTTKDIFEPDADPITIVNYKASQFDGVLIDDTSLVIKNKSVGANIKWLLDKLPDYAGRKAVFVSLLGIHLNKKVYIFKGEIHGTIVSSRGKPYGFLSYFEPVDTDKTLAEDLPDQFNARYFAVQNFLNNNPYLVVDPIYFWSGKFQNQ